MGKVSDWIAEMPVLADSPEIEEAIVTVDHGEEAAQHSLWAVGTQLTSSSEQIVARYSRSKQSMHSACHTCWPPEVCVELGVFSYT
jgi:hypothetical protein